MSYSILSGIATLIFLVGILGFTLYIVRKYNIRFNNKLGTDFKCRVLFTYPLMQKKYLSVVQVDDRVLLLGITDNNINILTELDSNLLARVSENDNQLQNVHIKFSELFKKLQLKNEK